MSVDNDSVPEIPVENWVDDEFLFHHEHVRKVDNKTVHISGGVFKHILRPGTGDYPLPHSRFEIHIIAKIKDTGKIIQNTRENFTLLQNDDKQSSGIFIGVIGNKDIPRGVELALCTMRCGELATLDVRSDFAYGDIGYDEIIPDNANMIYEIELVKCSAAPIKLADGISKRYIKKGYGWVTPSYDSTCHIYIQGCVHNEYNPLLPESDENSTDNVFLERTEYPLLAYIDDPMLPEGIEEALKSMKPGEISVYRITSNVLLGDGFEPRRHKFKLNIPQMPRENIPYPSSTISSTGGTTTNDTTSIENSNDDDNTSQYYDLEVYYTIELVEIERAQDPWALTLRQRLEEGERLKGCANEFFRRGLAPATCQLAPAPSWYTLYGKAGYFHRAEVRYLRILDLFISFTQHELNDCRGDDAQRIFSLLLACMNNLQIAYSRTKQWKQVIEIGDQAIDMIQTPYPVTPYSSNANKQIQQHQQTIVPSSSTPEQQEYITDALTGLVDKPITHESNPTIHGISDDNDNDTTTTKNKKNTKGGNNNHKSLPLTYTGDVIYAPQTSTSNIVKVVYRKAQALLATGETDKAIEILNTVQSLCNGTIPQNDIKKLYLSTLSQDEKKTKVENGQAYETQLEKLQNTLPSGISVHNWTTDGTIITPDTLKELDKIVKLAQKQSQTEKSREKARYSKLFNSDSTK